MWGGRFEKRLDERALRYTTSLPVDRRLFEWDVLGSVAHARMLGRCGIIPANDAAAIVAGLADLLRNLPALDGEYEDVHSLVEAGLLEARSGKVRLLKREEFPQEWKLKDKSHLTAWEVMQRMIHALLSGKGESEAGDILRQFSEQAELARDLAYRLYTVCERKGWAQEALAYNSLVTSWSEISRLAHREPEGIRQASFLS